MIYYSHVFKRPEPVQPDYTAPSFGLVEHSFCQSRITRGIFRQFVYTIFAYSEQLIRRTLPQLNICQYSQYFNYLSIYCSCYPLSPIALSSPIILSQLLIIISAPTHAHSHLILYILTLYYISYILLSSISLSLIPKSLCSYQSLVFHLSSFHHFLLINPSFIFIYSSHISPIIYNYI